MSTRTHIRNVPLFASLPAVEIDVMAATLPSAEHAPGTILCREGDPGDRLFVVLTGEVEIVKALETEEERVLAHSGPGDLIGEMSLLSPGEQRSASARVREPAEILELTREDFETLLRRYPALAFELLRVLSDRLRAADNATIRDLQEKNRQLAQANAELKAAQDRQDH